MKQKLVIIFGMVLLLAVLAGLNAATYTQKEKTPDAEATPNRSTFNSGPTGTQAFYTLLNETGRRVVRWQEPPAALLTSRANRPTVFVIVGAVRRDVAPDEIEPLLRWVSEGGRLVLVDRAPPEGLAVTDAGWKLSFHEGPGYEIYSVDPFDQQQMTRGTSAVKPVQPTVFTAGVNAVQPSRFAANVAFARTDDRSDGAEPEAPMAHIGVDARNLLVDVPYGAGRIVLLADPYIVSNGGIALVDNAQLAINLVATKEGVVAFDEYHQGYGSNNNRFFQFFEGTPIIAIFLQISLIVGLVFFSQSRRFGRPVPEPETDRLSKLEYVAAMAELQQRTRAHDLAIENIFTEFRRRATRAVGMDGTANTRDLAARIAERARLDAAHVERTLFTCEEVVRGEPTNKGEVLRLTRAIRDLEEKLGISRSRGRTR
jgi:hypothetical protein